MDQWNEISESPELRNILLLYCEWKTEARDCLISVLCLEKCSTVFMGNIFHKMSSDRGWKMPHLMSVTDSRMQMAYLFPWETGILHRVGTPQILLLLESMDLSRKLSVSELIVLTHAGISSVSGSGDDRFRYGDSPSWRGKDCQKYGHSHPREPLLFFTHPVALTFAFTFADDFFCYLVASTYVCIVRFGNH